MKMSPRMTMETPWTRKAYQKPKLKVETKSQLERKPKTTPKGTVRQYIEIQVVLEFSGAIISIQTGKQMTETTQKCWVSKKVTWQRPTRTRETIIMQKFEVIAKTLTKSPFPIEATTLTYLARQRAKTTGSSKQPSMFPKYKAEGKILNYV